MGKRARGAGRNYFRVLSRKWQYAIAIATGLVGLAICVAVAAFGGTLLAVVFVIYIAGMTAQSIWIGQTRAEDALRTSERLYRLFAENVSDTIWVLDLHARFSYLSPSFERLLGYKWDETKQLLMTDVVASESLPVAQNTFQCIIDEAQSGQPSKARKVEVELLRKDRSPMWAETTASAMFDEAGELVGVFGVTREITERKLAQARQARALRRLEGVNRLHEDLLLPGLLTEKLTKISDAAVELLDLDFCRIWMVQPSDLCQSGCIHGGTPPSIFCPLQDRCLHLRTSSGRYTHIDGGHRRVPLGAFKIGRIASGERNRFLTNDVTTDPEVGDHQWAKDLGLVSFAGYKLRGALGNPIGVLAVFAKHPLSEEEDAFILALAETTSRVILDDGIAEELRESRAQAVEANQAKSRFLASMSHEIRTPMTAILGYADVLMAPDINGSEQHNYAAVIRRNGEHLLTLINDILDLSKIEAGKNVIDIRRCSVVPLLADVASVVRPRAEQHGISVAVEYLGEMPETILSDSNRLRQAIINLTCNAVKFTERGSVRIVASLLADWRDGQPAVRFEIIDTGIGIREEALPRLFQPFSQADASISRRFGGTGLGLAISHQIALMLGGELKVTSVFGQGSTFTLTIPTGPLEGVAMLQQPAEMASDAGGGRASLVPPAILEGVRVLLAEDNSDNRILIEMVLRRVGAEVESVENGRLALAKAEAERFDVVLMDINMPEMDGVEATRLLRSHGYDRPIVALTANAMAGDSQKCREAGCNEHLTKPIDRAKLIRIVATFAGRQTNEAPLSTSPVVDVLTPSDEPVVSQFIDDPDISRILNEFVTGLESQVDAMHQAFANERFEELWRQAHKLKGAGGSYGYSSLTDAAEVLENAAKAQDFSAADAALDAVDRLTQAIENGYSAGTPAGRSES